MKRRSRSWSLFVSIATAAVAAALSPPACYGEGSPASPSRSRSTSTSRDASVQTILSDASTEASRDAGFLAEAAAPQQAVVCNPVRSSEPLPARSSVTSSAAPTGDQPVTTQDLFAKFKTLCGSCHVDQQLGGFQGTIVTLKNFPDLVDSDALAAIQSNDPDKVMPKAGLTWPERLKNPDDPVVQFAGLLGQWIKAGRPSDIFYIAVDQGSGSAKYTFSTELGATLTNIGNCIPEARFVATEKQKSAELDAKFAAATELPIELSDTDLVSFDSGTLARYGVVAYAPAYPLWTDDSGKLRHVRVPRGKSIQFDEGTQSFDIPANTRFYKTFLKKVIDSAGNERYRKIETRLIVSRPDDCSQNPCKQTALMGTYAWSDDESHATLVEDSLRNGTPFGDRLFTYVTDEAKAAGDRKDAAAFASVSRHYAIPGKFRCVQCHMGSPSASFVLGFTPLQINRRPYVEEPDLSATADQLKGYGVLQENAPGKDELTQLQRFIDYGIVTGIKDPERVKSLNLSGAVPPRNGYELKAQAYMLGNCSHCHNPRGFPTIQNPVLKDALNFLPSADGGGIFGFPLDRTSPRVHRGQASDIGIPYITPSLYDLQPLGGNSLEYAVKNVVDNRADSSTFGDYWYILAPWRSFIYRNVDTPFTYAEDFAFFPHMPLNSPGFDCRAPRILGDWMVSIPSRRLYAGLKKLGPESDESYVQPYVEVKPGDTGSPGAPSYDESVTAARARLDAYHVGARYDYCPDTSDIVDPEVVAGITAVPADKGYVIKQVNNPAVWIDGVPDRAHWVDTDTTEPSGPWTPRRADWSDVLIKKDPAKIKTPDEGKVIGLLASANIQLDPAFRTWALTEQPFTFWLDQDHSCAAELKSEPTIASLEAAGQPLPSWLSTVAFRDTRGVHKDDPLYSLSPGAAVFQNICINCHGTQGDGQSSLAATILSLTGGHTRVANLRDGILGSPSQPGSAREAVFGSAAKDLGIQTDDMAVRYLLWMGLGGTQRVIPDSALIVVGNTTVAGERRGKFDPTSNLASANMLNTARALCAAVLPTYAIHPDSVAYSLPLGREPAVPGTTPLLEDIGDAAMWRQLCSSGHKAPVRVVTYLKGFALAYSSSQQFKFYDPDAYGNQPVMTSHGVVNGVPATEPEPWCLSKGDILPADVATVEAARNDPKNLVGGQPVPYCPDPAELAPPETWNDVLWTGDQQDAWALRGAMNAGMAVFAYLDAVAKGTVVPKVQYSECDKLP